MRQIASALVFGILLGCEDPQQPVNPKPPEACGPSEDVTLYIGDRVSVETCFNDENVGALVYSGGSSDDRVVTVTSVGNVVELHAVGVGEAGVRVTATDPDGLSGVTTFKVNVPNRDPESCAEPDDVETFVGETVTVPICFRDPDRHELEITAATTTDFVSLQLTDSAVSVTGVRPGGPVDVVVTATDPVSASVSATFSATVPNRAPRVSEAIPDRIVPWAGVVYDLRRIFSDPDGEELAYTADSGDLSLFTATIDTWPYLSTLRVKPVRQSDIPVTITVTATDAAGESAVETFTATGEGVGLLSEEWDSADALDTWEVLDEWIPPKFRPASYDPPSAEVRDGLLYLYPSSNVPDYGGPGNPGDYVAEIGVGKEFSPVEDGWTISWSFAMSSQNESAETCIRLNAAMDDDYYSDLALDIVHHASRSYWVVLIGFDGAGLSDPYWVELDLGSMDTSWPLSRWEMTEVLMSVKEGVFELVAGDYRISLDLLSFPIILEPGHDWQWPPSKWPSRLTATRLNNIPVWYRCGEAAPNGGASRSDRSNVVVDWIRVRSKGMTAPQGNDDSDETSEQPVAEGDQR